MATIAIGDVHGNFAALDDVLGQLRPELSPADTVVFLGDYIDRGPQTKECIDAILAFERDCPADVVCLRGNHEEWMLETAHDYFRHSWALGMEAFTTIESYSVDAARTLREARKASYPDLYSERCALPYELFFCAVPAEHLRFFERLQTMHETADCLCTHGGVDPWRADIREPCRALIWGASGFPEEYDGPTTIVYGHWNNAVVNEDGWPSPLVMGRTIGIDSSKHGVLTAIRLPDQRVFQSARYR